MKISVRIEDVEVCYEEEKYKTTESQDKNFMNLCIEKALLIYSEKLKYTQHDSILEVDNG